MLTRISIGNCCRMEVVGFGPASEPDIMFVMVLYGSLNANVEMDFQLIVSVKPIVEFAK
jgi:hypothetical protein